MKRLLHTPFEPVKRTLINPLSSKKTLFTLSKMPPSYKQRTIHPEIKLNPVETKIRDLLVEFCDDFNANQKIPEKDIVLRVTGGWVRDKLLGDESNDLDIAINHLSGELFTQELMQYIKENKAGEQDIIGHSIHKIEKNPEKSKHLETCTTKLYGLDIDFVNLRNEEYTEESRIPKITYGTPTEDAYRRDATLNALFYNLQTQAVEDFTEKGIEDLSKGILRTPLPAKKTFLDDPLRCLRLIRFASRFGFEVDQEALELMKDESIRLALMRKISRERVGVEIHKILQGPIPEYGLELICETGLYDSIFNFGDNFELIEKLNEKQMPLINECFAKGQQELGKFNELLSKSVSLICDSLLGDRFQDFINDKQNKKYIYLLLILKNWEEFKVIANTKKFKNEIFVTDLIIKEGLKFSSKEGDTITLVINNSKEFHHIMDESLDSFKRSTLGLLIRKYGAERWELAIWFNLLKDLFTNEKMIPKYISFQKLINEQDLSQIWNVKPIIDGKSLLKELNLKPGPWMKLVNDELFKWQLDNPDKQKEECLKYVKEILPNYI